MSVSHGLQYSDEEFKLKLGLSRDTFEFLHFLLRPELMKKGKGGIPITDTREQLLIGLWRINHTTQDPFSSVAKRFNVSRGAVFASVHRVIKALNKLAPVFNDWPTLGRTEVVHLNDKLYMPLPNENDPTELALTSLEPDNVVSIVEKAYRQWKSLKSQTSMEVKQETMEVTNKANRTKISYSEPTPLILSGKRGRKRPAKSDAIADASDSKDPKLAADLVKEHIKKCQGGFCTESQLSTLGLLVDSGIDLQRPPSPLRIEAFCSTRGSEKWPNAAVWALLEAYKKHRPSAGTHSSAESPFLKKIIDDLREVGFLQSPQDCMKKLNTLKKQYNKWIARNCKVKPEDKESVTLKWPFMDICDELWGQPPDGESATQIYPGGTGKWSHNEVLVLLNSYEQHLRLGRSAPPNLETCKLLAEDLQTQDMTRTPGECYKKLKGLKRHYKRYRWNWLEGQRKWIFADRCAKLFEPQPDKAKGIENQTDLKRDDFRESSENVTVEVISGTNEHHEMEEGVVLEEGVLVDFVCGDDILPDDAEGQRKLRSKAIQSTSEGHSRPRQEQNSAEGTLAHLLELSLLQGEKFAEADRQRHSELIEADKQLLQVVDDLIKRRKLSK